MAFDLAQAGSRMPKMATRHFWITNSPSLLKLQLLCASKMPVKKLLDICPKIPLIIENDSKRSSEAKIANLIAALEHRDRVQEIAIRDPLTRDGLWERIAMVMQEPFPELSALCLQSLSGVLTLPNTFLNRSAPCLQDLTLSEISFPSLPQLLLSTRDLTSLHLFNIPNSGYIPPETMATCLSVLPKLKFLTIRFRSPTYLPKRGNRPVPPQTRSVLPALTELDFQGINEYLEVLVAQIDAPLLRFDRFKIVFSERVHFDLPQTIRFFDQLDSFGTSSLTLRFNGWPFSLDSSREAVFFPSHIVPCEFIMMGNWLCDTIDDLSYGLGLQVSSMAQICNQIPSFRSSVESLVIRWDGYSSLQEIKIYHTAWLELFRSFPSVQSLQIPAMLEQSIADALVGPTGEFATYLLPSLHSLSIVGRVSDKFASKGIQSYITARQNCGRPVTVSRPGRRRK
jgi:hypothetical protein